MKPLFEKKRPNEMTPDEMLAFHKQVVELIGMLTHSYIDMHSNGHHDLAGTIKLKIQKFLAIL